MRMPLGFSRSFGLGMVYIVLLLIAVFRIHMRTSTTLIGYELGTLKAEEMDLLRERSLLQMQMAKLTTLEHLQLVAQSDEWSQPSSSSSVASIN